MEPSDIRSETVCWPSLMSCFLVSILKLERKWKVVVKSCAVVVGGLPLGAQRLLVPKYVSVFRSPEVIAEERASKKKKGRIYASFRMVEFHSASETSLC